MVGVKLTLNKLKTKQNPKQQTNNSHRVPGHRCYHKRPGAGATHSQGPRCRRRRKALVNGLEGGGRDPRDGVHDDVSAHGACGERPVRQERGESKISDRGISGFLPVGRLVPVTDVLMAPAC